MLSCKEVTAQASDFKDKNLSWYQNLNLRMHLLMCRNCQRFSAQFNTAITVSRKAGLQHASEEEVDGIVEFVSKSR